MLPGLVRLVVQLAIQESVFRSFRGPELSRIPRARSKVSRHHTTYARMLLILAGFEPNKCCTAIPKSNHLHIKDSGRYLSTPFKFRRISVIRISYYNTQYGFYTTNQAFWQAAMVPIQGADDKESVRSFYWRQGFCKKTSFQAQLFQL